MSMDVHVFGCLYVCVRYWGNLMQLISKWYSTVLHVHTMNTYVVITAIICAQLGILLVPLVTIPMLMHAIRSTSTNSLVCVRLGIFHRPIKLSP